ncbi:MULTISPECIES: phage virion morphogenesis protein [Pseudomonas]|uniref:phage virion morphogenesis protein n=1 Tax=Pseudomonas TaxID=286 RepID=UPI00192BD37C|nr:MULTISPECIES: phage virion morphogenesis protein [Pseudomonas]QQZ36046.1 phage virion morphogenesis protein [Pseudomonas sp. SK2]WKL67830.1 phage virion morphogenesis protein [Pseudomonas qingdaonensis]
MADDLRALEDWAGVLLARLEPGARRQLNQQIGRELRRSQQQRVASQRNPDGTPYAPRKLRGKVGRIKRQMFTKLRQAAHLKLRSTPDAIAISFMGRVARIARVHQYGLRDRPDRGQAEVQYERRELLGFTEADLELIRDQLLEHLTR